ncbi:MAG: hydrogenase formation protein HypD, partial [Gammaproteobacteria bacterium]|nr:hydrogenase formation protein HypD [Gammaproteobacteria bacterium]
EKAKGADVRTVYSTLDALAIAQAEPHRQVVFFAIGFETTTPATAFALKEAKSKSINNFSVFCNHVLTPAALGAILNTNPGERQQINGIIGPSHVSTIIGSVAYNNYATQYQLPIVIAGFEPLDVLQSILMLVRQINNKQYIVENEYTRSVNAQGNQIAQTMISETMETRDSFEWRGLGFVPHSALQIKPAYAEYDAETRFSMSISQGREQKGCECPAVLRGTKLPTDCKLFATVCRPDNPLGACMVSSEGSCAAYWSYGRQRKPVSKEACSA